ncbi:glycosyltransferase family 4 protein [Flavobacterium soyangense]|uniref:Glycosyltransferase family 4 protein n=1 Tax=Flavobacterium soyangense TaxID=2023265 RepID=A0A930UD25_9FLAO|nr:glycosyltransferase family 1 protein [Flavobacterium soyangense]MBF2708190.1 glycosyltransferase family 4 protein [Flavobacterium soyangense]
MKIYINARFLTQPISGVQRFAIEISKELKKSNLSLVFLAPKNIIHHELAEELGVTVLGNLKGHLWEQIELQTYVLKNNALLISFCNTAPLFIKNQIVTIHDLCFRVHPEWFSKSFAFFYNFLIPQLVRVSKGIITVSNVSKQELIKELNVPEDKITVIYNAVASVFEIVNSFKLSKSESPIPFDYILSVSSHHPRKNFERLVKAFKLIKQDNLKLCIIGNMNKNFNSTELEIEDNVIYLQNISDCELIEYYKHSKLFVFASIYEGFGIPIIEALKVGVPICISDIPVFHEICQESALYFDPYNINDIKDKIIESLSDSSRSNDIDFKRFSWKDGASKILKLINENF